MTSLPTLEWRGDCMSCYNNKKVGVAHAREANEKVMALNKERVEKSRQGLIDRNIERKIFEQIAIRIKFMEVFGLSETDVSSTLPSDEVQGLVEDDLK